MKEKVFYEDLYSEVHFLDKKNEVTLLRKLLSLYFKPALSPDFGAFYAFFYSLSELREGCQLNYSKINPLRKKIAVTVSSALVISKLIYSIIIECSKQFMYFCSVLLSN